MRKLFLLFVFAICLSNSYAAPFQFLPYTITQPNGEIIECFVSGDEFFNWIHDKNGYTIVQASDGYYYYAISKGGNLVSSSYKVNQVKPETIEVKPWMKISIDEYQKKAQRNKVSDSFKSSGSNHAPHTGTLNNLVVYIRFSGESEIVTTRQNYDNKLNLTAGVSLKSYYSEVSYNNLTISSTHYPACAFPSTSNASFQDSHKRAYFQPYNATTNTLGYKSESESTQREQTLLRDAIVWINANHPVNAGLNIDSDGDGRVDNVCFMVKGNSDAWADLLWAHRSSLYNINININGKRVYDYTFQPENQVTVRTLCHEMFHALGAPDLYHYDDQAFSPVGGWDVMHSGGGHMSAYMKWKYANAKWITSIPEILTSGTYTLNPLTSSSNNCFKIKSPSSDKEFFVVEYRKTDGNFESNLPNSGLLVYRINTDFIGNANFDNLSVFDEVYIYRPGGTNFVNGAISDAYFALGVGRTAINENTNPKSFLHNGLPGRLDISNITAAGATISFSVYISDVKVPQNFTATSFSESQVDLSWGLNTDNNNVILVYSTSGVIGSPEKGVNYSTGSFIPGGGSVIYSGNATSYNHSALTAGTNYYYRIWSKNGTNEYSSCVSVKGTTNCSAPIIPIIQGFNGSEISPCWKVELVEQGEVETAAVSITQVQSSLNPTATPSEGTHMIKFNSMDCGVGNTMRLSSPAFSTIGQSHLYINFAWYRGDETPQLDNMKIQWSSDGPNWISGTTYQRFDVTNGWTVQSYKLPDATLNQNNLKIAFLFRSEFGYNCYLDNVKISTTSTVGVEGNAIDNVLVYPNPTKGLFKVKVDQPYNNMRVEVRDVCGRIVLQKNYQRSHENIVDLSTQPKGIYLLTIQADNRILNQKMVVE